MPVWSKAATAQLKLKILDSTVPTNPAELTNDYLYSTLSAIIFPDYHLTGPTGKASVIQRFRTAFNNMQLENKVARARRVVVGAGKIIFSLLESSESPFMQISSSPLFLISAGTFDDYDDDDKEEYDKEEEEYDLEEEEEEEMARAPAAGRGSAGQGAAGRGAAGWGAAGRGTAAAAAAA